MRFRPAAVLALVPALVSLAFFLACGSGGEARSPSIDECGQLTRPASDKVEAAIAANLACSTDEDCMNIGIASACFDQCSRPVAKSGRAAVGQALASVGDNECKAFASAGCKVIVPPCAPPRPAACQQGKCG